MVNPGECPMSPRDECIFYLCWRECSLRSVWISVWFKSSVFLGIFSLDDLFIAESRVFKSFTVIGLLYMSPLRYVTICLIYLGALILHM